MIGDIFSLAFLTGFLAATVRLAAPIIFVSLGETFAQRSGVINLGVEGIMTVGCFSAFVTTYFTGNPWLGLLSGLAAGGLLAIVHAFFTITLGINQIIIGLAIFMLGSALTGFIFRGIFGVTLTPPIISGFEPIHIPILNQIPVIGPALFQQTFLVYLAFLLIPICGIILFKTTFGLKIRSVGENPRASDARGVNVYRTRYLCVIFGGLMAGIGGAFLVLSIPKQSFLELIVAGRGWIAIAIVIFSRWNPYWVPLGALLFSGIDALQLRLQVLGVAVPYHLLLMLPYLVTLIVFIFRSKGLIRPAALNVPYRRE